jgi:hypothetical protein
MSVSVVIVAADAATGVLDSGGFAMRLVPESNGEKVEFYAVRVGRWAEHALEIGTSPADVAALEAETADARAALRAQRVAQNAARSATIRLNLAIEKMARRGAAIVQQIRARALTSGEGVFSLASIAPPAKGSPIGPPGQPTGFAIELRTVGSLVLRWKCKSPRGAVGTLYHVHRKIVVTGAGGGDGKFEYLGCTGERKFVDETVPAGASAIIYQIQAMRSTATGPSATFNVNFGGGRRAGSPVSIAA